jgi:hypothetical protein
MDVGSLRSSSFGDSCRGIHESLPSWRSSANPSVRSRSHISCASMTGDPTDHAFLRLPLSSATDEGRRMRDWRCALELGPHCG